jgi:formylglycine-generating enzyme required for sulfatase activity
MRLVAAGEFTMVSEDGDADEKPVHQVYLDSYYMDTYEVTNALYKACVDIDGCTRPSQSRSYTHGTYYGNSLYNDYPVIYVSWNQAKTYCEWRNARLPSEAEWEKAARGTDDRTYPWGKGLDREKANYSGDKAGDTTKVGSYVAGVSPYGLYDMAGNVWEWVADWYDLSYYKNSPMSNPVGPSSGAPRALRGGGWFSDEPMLRSANRFQGDPSGANVSFGFRCARSAP